MPKKYDLNKILNNGHIKIENELIDYIFFSEKWNTLQEKNIIAPIWA